LPAELKTRDPEYYEQVDRQNHTRVIRALEVIRTAGKPYSALRKAAPQQRPFAIHKIALDMPRPKLYERINQRVDNMLEMGLIEEARQLHPLRGLNALETVGYRELFEYFEGKYDLDEAIRLIKRNTRRYAKRQLTWLRRDQQFHWFSPNDRQAILDWIRSKTA
jgi:tRNA dimethylallyltransferase